MNFCAPYMSWLKPLSTLCICGLVFTWGDGTNKKKINKDLCWEDSSDSCVFTTWIKQKLFPIGRKVGQFMSAPGPRFATPLYAVTGIIPKLLLWYSARHHGNIAWQILIQSSPHLSSKRFKLFHETIAVSLSFLHLSIQTFQPILKSFPSRLVVL